MPDEDLEMVAKAADPESAYKLGLQLKAAGKFGAAAAAFRKAMGSPNGFAKGTAALMLAGVLENQRDVVGAERAYESALGTGDSQIVPAAAFALAMLRREIGDLEGALSAFQVTFNSGSERFAADAALGIGDLLLKRGDRGAARIAYQKAVSFVPTDVIAAARGRLRLAELDYSEGRTDAALSELGNLAHSAPKVVAVAAAFSLGKYQAGQGNLEAARRAFQQVIESGESPWVDYGNRAMRQLLQH